jgi:hypothetical protein
MRQGLKRRKLPRRRPLEQPIETTATRIITKDLKGISRKMNGLGFRSWPDRVYLKLGVKRPLWIEFKRPGEPPTDAQAEIHKQLRAQGQEVQVHDTWSGAVDAFITHHD